MNEKQRKTVGRRANASHTRLVRFGKWLAEAMASALAKALVNGAAALLTAVLMACLPAALDPHKAPSGTSGGPAPRMLQA